MFVCKREKDSGGREGERKRKGVFSIAAVERKREWKRDKERGGGVRGVYSGTGSLSA